MTKQIKEKRTNKLTGADEKKRKDEGEFYYLDRPNLKVQHLWTKERSRIQIKA